MKKKTVTPTEMALRMMSRKRRHTVTGKTVEVGFRFEDGERKPARPRLFEVERVLTEPGHETRVQTISGDIFTVIPSKSNDATYFAIA
jgi:hypothetical protein